MKKFLSLVMILVTIWSCETGSKLDSEIDAIAVTIELDRFDHKFAVVTPEKLPELKKEYPYLFSRRYDDAYWENKLTDTIQKELEKEVDVVFQDAQDVEGDLENLFKHIKYYFPEATIPKAIGVATDVDYRSKLVLADSLLLISLATYLGEEHHFYTGIATYHTKNFRKAQIVVDVAAAFAKTNIPNKQTNTFLSEMIYHGKQLYLMELLLSQKPKHEVFSYTPEEYAFAVDNEVNVWEFFVSRELLFSTDRKLLPRFINPAPFSKFYLDFDNETPGRIGRYIGYKIVKSYMDKNDTSLKRMLLLDAETLFNKANYKP